MKILSKITAMIFAFICVANAQNIPGTRFDENIPTVEQVFGYKSGEDISAHGDMVRYFDVLKIQHQIG